MKGQDNCNLIYWIYYDSPDSQSHGPTLIFLSQSDVMSKAALRLHCYNSNFFCSLHPLSS